MEKRKRKRTKSEKVNFESTIENLKKTYRDTPKLYISNLVKFKAEIKTRFESLRTKKAGLWESEQRLQYENQYKENFERDKFLQERLLKREQNIQNLVNTYTLLMQSIQRSIEFRSILKKNTGVILPIEIPSALAGTGNQLATNILNKFINKQSDIAEIAEELKKFTDNHKEYLGHSLFDIACSEGWFLIVGFLVNNSNVDVNTINPDGLSPLQAAYKKQHLAVVEFLLQNPLVDQNKKMKGGVLTLHLACTDGLSGIVKLLLSKKKTDPNACIETDYWPMFNNFRVNPFNIAILNRHFNIVDLILEDDRFKPESNDELLMVLLTTYSESNHQLIHFKKLLAKGINPNKEMNLIEQKFKGNALELAKFLNLSNIVNYFEHSKR